MLTSMGRAPCRSARAPVGGRPVADTQDTRRHARPSARPSRFGAATMALARSTSISALESTTASLCKVPGRTARAATHTRPRPLARRSLHSSWSWNQIYTERWPSIDSSAHSHRGNRGAASKLLEGCARAWRLCNCCCYCQSVHGGAFDHLPSPPRERRRSPTAPAAWQADATWRAHHGTSYAATSG